jgi:hypothetical protein
MRNTEGTFWTRSPTSLRRLKLRRLSTSPANSRSPHNIGKGFVGQAGAPGVIGAIGVSALF